MEVIVDWVQRKLHNHLLEGIVRLDGQEESVVEHGIKFLSLTNSHPEMTDVVLKGNNLHLY